MDKNLRLKMKKAERAHWSTLPERKAEIFDYLNDQLHYRIPEGEVASILVFDAHRKINCYGQRLNEEAIFQGLNLSSGVEGTHLTGRIAYPELHRLSEAYKSGYFVKGENFQVKDKYVALVNVKRDLEAIALETYSYPHK